MHGAEMTSVKRGRRVPVEFHLPQTMQTDDLCDDSQSQEQPGEASARRAAAFLGCIWIYNSS